MKFKDRLKELRTERKMSQKSLAEKLSYGSTAIANYESGRNEPSIRDLITISHTLNVSIDYLLGITDIQNPYMQDETYEQFCEIRRVFSLLSAENAAEVLRYADYRLQTQNQMSKQKRTRRSKSVTYETASEDNVTDLMIAEEPVKYEAIPESEETEE